ncbi:MAG TPA: tRNA (adenosine(37)-N6)-threonylcarbamoyltransferase complex ATPase subunit type 1 TsaE [Anaerolineales bacterium]|nr:tRNA (adenosine(37)-N6)-threonylcarbamoyltransferase complex ATPase subunit type 1 TsaE [Anaerolineales bacterium]
MSILKPRSMEFISRSADQTRRAGLRLGSLLEAGDLIGLVGDLGAGKTTLMQGIASGWGSLDQVTSPTFVLVNMYRRPNLQRLYHLDAYRLNSPAEAHDLDLDSMLEEAALVVEWAEKIQETLPVERLWLEIKWVDEYQRDFLITAFGSRYLNLLSEFRRQLFGVS